MDLSKLDCSTGKAFSSKVFARLSSLVTSSWKPAGQGFFLLVSFSRNRFRLTKDPVGLCLHSVLGGNAKDFNPFLPEDQIFRFSVSSKQVGLLVIELDQVIAENFKLVFFFCNDSGFQKALRFAKLDSGPTFSWEKAKSGKSRDSYVDAAKSRKHPLTGANAVPIGNRSEGSVPPRRVNNLNSRSIVASSVFSGLQFPRRPVFDRISFEHSSGYSKNSNSANSQRAYKVVGSSDQAFSRPDTVAAAGNYCARCLSSNHSNFDCPSNFKCWHCKEWGHKIKSCARHQDLQKFIKLVGENPSCNFSSNLSAANWPKEPRLTRFKGKGAATNGT